MASMTSYNGVNQNKDLTLQLTTLATHITAKIGGGSPWLGHLAIYRPQASTDITAHTYYA